MSERLENALMIIGGATAIWLGLEAIDLLMRVTLGVSWIAGGYV